VAAADQSYVAAEDALQHRRDQRVVGATEDQGVDLSALQRRAIGTGHLEHALIEGGAVLDEGRQVGCLDFGYRKRPSLGLQGAPVGAALDRVRRCQHPDPAAVGNRGGDLGLRLDHRDHLHPMLRRDFTRHPLADRGRRVAGNHQQLRAALQQHRRNLPDSLPQPLRITRAIGEHRRIAEIDEVLLRQRDQALVQHGEATDAGIEHRDRLRGVQGSVR